MDELYQMIIFIFNNHFLMFVLRVGIDQVYKLFSHFTEHQVVGELGI